MTRKWMFLVVPSVCLVILTGCDVFRGFIGAANTADLTKATEAAAAALDLQEKAQAEIERVKALAETEKSALLKQYEDLVAAAKTATERKDFEAVSRLFAESVDAKAKIEDVVNLAKVEVARIDASVRGEIDRLTAYADGILKEHRESTESTGYKWGNTAGKLLLAGLTTYFGFKSRRNGQERDTESGLSNILMRTIEKLKPDDDEKDMMGKFHARMNAGVELNRRVHEMRNGKEAA